MNDPYSMFIEHFYCTKSVFVDFIQDVPYYTCMNERLPGTNQQAV